MLTKVIHINYGSLFPEGSSPKIDVKEARVAKKFILSCNASGYPQPTVMAIVGNKQKKTNTIEVEKGQTYQCIAHNGFGTDIKGVYQSKIYIF